MEKKGPGTSTTTMTSLSVFELKGRCSGGEKDRSTPGSPLAQQCGGLSIGGINPDSTTTQSNSQNLNHHKSSSSTTGPTTGTTTNMYSLKWNTQLLALQRSLANLWDNGIGTDAVLLCQGTPLPVHKIILTAASPYVASVVQTMVTASHMMPVIVVDIPPEAGKALLSFLYCGEAHVPVSVIPQLVAGAKFLGISGFGEPGVLESLTGMVPESGQTNSHRNSSPSPSHHIHHREKSSRVMDCPTSKGTTGADSKEESGIPTMQLPQIPSIHGVHVSSIPSPSPTPSVQSSHSNYSYHSSGRRGESRSGDRSKSSSPFPPPPAFLESLKLSRVSPGSKSKDSPPGKSGAGRVYLGSGTSILDNLLKNPRNHTGQQSNPNSYMNEGPVNLSCNSNADDTEEGDGDSEYGESSLYYSPSHGSGHFMLQDGGGDDGENDGDDSGPIPAQLLEPNVEYHIGNEFSRERYGNGRGGSGIGLPLSIQNPLIDLAKVASAMQSHQQQIQQYQQQQLNRGQHIPLSEPSTTRGVKRKPRNVTNQDGDLISSTPSLQGTKPPKAKKPQEAIICDICNKKFSNAYNLRVHMEGHSGQVFVCSVCSHASRSRDALRKHFAYRHRELWVRGMSAFRKGSAALPTGRKLGISKSNSSENIKMEDEPNNNNSLVDANGNISLNVRGGSDGTLTISEAFPPPTGVKTEI